MGFIPGLLGIGGGGGNFKAASAQIISPTTADQAGAAYDQSQQALQKQQAFVNAVAAQNGLANQSNVYNQLGGIANGTGPNPAAAMLNTATGNNVANTAALAAGQRGAGSNVGLIARQVGQQGANTQQQAVGQGASLQANQALNALSEQGNIAGNQVATQAGAVNNLNQAAQSEQSNLLNSINATNNANVSNVANQNTSNAAVQGEVAKGQQSVLGGVLGGVSSALGLAKGGMVEPFATGGPVPEAAGPTSFAGKFLKGFATGVDPTGPNGTPLSALNNPEGAALKSGVSSLVGGALGKIFAPSTQAPDQAIVSPDSAPNMAGNQGEASPDPTLYAAKGGKVPAMLSPGEEYLPPDKAKKVAAGKASPLSGTKVPGKAKVGGDSLQNDTVPKKLEPGGVVIPRSVMQSEDPAANAARFVAAIVSRQGLKRKSHAA